MSQSSSENEYKTNPFKTNKKYDKEDKAFVTNDVNYTALQALHLSVGDLCRSIEKNNQEACSRVQSKKNIVDTDHNPCVLDDSTKTTVCPHMSQGAILALAEMTYTYITECLASDLMSFSKHANRRTITIDDVLLVARKNPRGLLDTLKDKVDQLKRVNESSVRKPCPSKDHSKVKSNSYLDSESSTTSSSNLSSSSDHDIVDSGQSLKQEVGMHSNFQYSQHRRRLRKIIASSPSSSSSSSSVRLSVASPHRSQLQAQHLETYEDITEQDIDETDHNVGDYIFQRKATQYDTTKKRRIIPDDVLEDDYFSNNDGSEGKIETGNHSGLSCNSAINLADED